MGFGYLALGILFLFNPTVNIFDVLPDCVGYLLIYHGLFRMSFLADNLKEARGYVWRLALVTLVRALMTFFPHNSNVYALLYVFVFGVLETLWFIPFVNTLFDGFYSLGMRLGADSVYGTKIVGKPAASGEAPQVRTVPMERLKVYTIVFFLIRTAAAVLPELTTLQAEDTFAASYSRQVRWISFRPLLYVIAVTVTLVFGIVWLVRMLRYLRGMRRDETLTEGIRAYYSEHVENDAGLLAAIRMKRALTMILLAAVASVLFILDGISLIPHFVAAFFAAFALAVMFSYERRWSVIGWVLSAAVGVLSIVNLVLQIPYFDEYDAMAARFINRAQTLYAPIRLLATLEQVLMIALFGVVLAVFCRVMKQHAALIPFIGNPATFSAEARRAEIRQAIYARVLGVSISGVLYFALCAAYYTVSMTYEAFWIACVFAYILWIVFVVQLVNAAQDNLYDRLEQKF